ncbi:MAG: HAMP domain-containing histidine kinase [Gemmatimonadetes bacterium]|nr:HAMP domain-containing histidine kinase [Gemmatimonadota bacterium]
MGRDRSAAVVLGIEPTGEPLTHQLLGARLYLHTIVRVGIALSLVVGALVGREFVGITDLDVRAFTILAGVILAYDGVAWLLIRRFRSPGEAVLHYRLLQHLMHLTIALDFLALTTAVWLMGGARSPFLAFYLLHLILAAVLLSPREAAISTITAYGLLAGLVIGEWAGLIPVHHVEHITGAAPLDGRYAGMLLAVYGLLFGTASYMLVTLSRALQVGEAQMQATLVALERVSALRRDFLHIAVHNMGAPVGAVSMFLQNLRDGLAGPLNEKQEGWVDRALLRLDGLSHFLVDLRVLATLEAGRMEEEMSAVDVSPLLAELVDEYQDIAAARQQNLVLEAEAELTVWGNERLLREAVVNYITNAIKYSADGGCIAVHGERIADIVRVTVEDDGPGIAPEDQTKLFAEFQRLAQPDDSEAPSGTGLGLSIVRRIAEAHGGSVGLESRPGEGSRFYLDLPAA